MATADRGFRRGVNSSAVDETSTARDQIGSILNGTTTALRGSPLEESIALSNGSKENESLVAPSLAPPSTQNDATAGPELASRHHPPGLEGQHASRSTIAEEPLEAPRHAAPSPGDWDNLHSSLLTAREGDHFALSSHPASSSAQQDTTALQAPEPLDTNAIAIDAAAHAFNKILKLRFDSCSLSSHDGPNGLACNSPNIEIGSTADSSAPHMRRVASPSETLMNADAAADQESRADATAFYRRPRNPAADAARSRPPPKRSPPSIDKDVDSDRLRPQLLRLETSPHSDLPLTPATIRATRQSPPEGHVDASAHGALAQGGPAPRAARPPEITRPTHGPTTKDPGVAIDLSPNKGPRLGSNASSETSTESKLAPNAAPPAGRQRAAASTKQLAPGLPSPPPPPPTPSSHSQPLTANPPRE